MFNLEHQQQNGRKAHRGGGGSQLNRMKTGASAKARSMMNLHNNEAGRRVSPYLYVYSTHRGRDRELEKYILSSK